jgi:hypothetical protein
MKKHITVFILLCTLVVYASSQSLSPDIVAVQGGFDQGDQMTLEWTLGENFVETVAHKDQFFTQGFHQPIFRYDSKFQQENQSEFVLDISVSPNPVSYHLNIYLDTKEATLLDISLYNINGQLVKQLPDLTYNTNISMDVAELPAGIYLLQVSNKDFSIVEKYKIIKI